MSPRVKITLECPHAECEEYYSTRRGTVTRTIICRHPENAGCLCAFDPRVSGVCVWRAEEEAPEEVEEK